MHSINIRLLKKNKLSTLISSSLGSDVESMSYSFWSEEFTERALKLKKKNKQKKHGSLSEWRACLKLCLKQTQTVVPITGVAKLPQRGEHVSSSISAKSTCDPHDRSCHAASMAAELTDFTDTQHNRGFHTSINKRLLKTKKLSTLNSGICLWTL